MYSQDWNSSDVPARRGGPFSVTPWVRRLLLANAVVFLLTFALFRGPWVVNVFGFNPQFALQQPWTFFTYMFIHGGVLHLAFNMLMLFFFGTAVEERMGGAAFIRYYLLCGLGGAALSLALTTVWTVGSTIGASAAVFGVALAFAIHWPDAPVYVFPLPFPIKAKWLVVGLVTLDLAAQLAQADDGVAHLAHLGGFLFGLAYLKGLPLLAERASAAVEQREPEVRVLVHPTGHLEHEGGGELPASPRAKDATDEVDRVLDKISASGMDSLTPDERRILAERSRELRRD